MAIEHPPDFSADVSAWMPVTVGDAQLALSSVSRGDEPALRMDFDFGDAGGFVVARRIARRVMHEDYVVRFRLRGRGPVNDLELKLIDATGLNVWRHVTKNLRPPARSRKMRIDSRDIEFAWGPTSGGVITELGAIEIAIVAREGGAGTMWIGDLEIEDCSPAAATTARASSAVPGRDASQALGSTGWTPHSDDAQPWIAIEFPEPRRLGGLIIDWRDRAPETGFRLRGSLQGRRWQTLHATQRAGGTRSYIYLPDTKTRFLRLELNEPSAGAALRPQSFEFSRSIDSFWYNVARGEPRGWYPRWLLREQILWSPIGTSNSTHCALMNEEGVVEIEPGSFSIEPMLWINDKLFAWTDVALGQELLEGFMPVPSAIWEAADWRLRVQAEATTSGRIQVRYRVENLSDQA